MWWPLAPIVAGLVWSLAAARMGREVSAGVGKMVASTGFLAAAFVHGVGPAAWGLVVAGLCLCWLGDLALISSQKKHFLLGLGAFLLGHLCYGAAFLVVGVDVVGLAVGLACMALAAIATLRWLWPHVRGPMRGPVVAYVVAIAAMVGAATGAWTASPWWLVGAVLFAISDLFVARNRFVAPGWNNRVVGLPLYYAAQWILAWQASLL